MKNLYKNKSPFKCVYIALTAVFLLSSSCYAQSSEKDSNKDSKISSYQYLKKLNQVYDFVQQNYVDEIDPKVLYEGALKGMMEALGDPYTVYLDERSMRDLNDTTAGSFGGVGLSISKATENPSYIEVASPIEDGPGMKAGIQTGDKITAVDGNPTDEMSLDEAVSLLRGEIGTSVVVSILRGANMKFDVTLVRALIEVPTVKYGMIEGTSTGYARLIQFTPDTPLRLQDAIEEFEKNNYTSLIIDLRDNPGGLITSAVDVVDKFVDAGPVVSTKSRVLFESRQYNASKSKTTVKKGIPVVILINRGSASASEIVSGALKDYHIAYLVGERTYGKGSVQQVVTLFKDDGIKFTMAKYYTPSDTNIDKIGIPPDLEVKNIETFTPEQEEIYLKLINSKEIDALIEKNPNMSEADISNEAKTLAKTYNLDERFLRRLIRVQVLKSQPSPLYDLDYDLQLQAALKIVADKNFSELVQNTKTLKELQEEAEKEADLVVSK